MNLSMRESGYIIIMILCLHIYNVARNSITFSNCTDGDVRLAGGRFEYEGRVEICISGVWGTVCYSTSRYSWYNNWNTADARVVCRQLGHQELG